MAQLTPEQMEQQARLRQAQTQDAGQQADLLAIIAAYDAINDASDVAGADAALTNFNALYASFNRTYPDSYLPLDDTDPSYESAPVDRTPPPLDEIRQYARQGEPLVEESAPVDRTPPPLDEIRQHARPPVPEVPSDPGFTGDPELQGGGPAQPAPAQPAPAQPPPQPQPEAHPLITPSEVLRVEELVDGKGHLNDKDGYKDTDLIRDAIAKVREIYGDDTLFQNLEERNKEGTFASTKTSIEALKKYAEVYERLKADGVTRSEYGQMLGEFLHAIEQDDKAIIVDTHGVDDTRAYSKAELGDVRTSTAQVQTALKP